jgi:hypothetical protein
MTYNLPTVEQGDDFEEVSFIFPFSLTGLTIDMIVYNSVGPKAVFNYNKYLKIDIMNNKKLKIETHAVTIQSGNYGYKIKLNPGNIRTTYLEGNWLIK